MSSSFRGLSYRDIADEIGALARVFTGWTRADLYSLPVRERRHWINWALHVRAQARSGPDGM